MRTLLLSTLALPVFLLPCGAADWDRYKEDFRFSHKLNSNGRLSIESFNGSVTVTAWDRNEVEVTGTKYASEEGMLKEVKVDVTNTPESFSLRAYRPKEWSWRNGGAGVRMEIRVPKKVQVDRLSSSNGGLTLDGIEGAARMSSSNGTLKITRLNGTLDASTSNGSIELMDINGGVTLRTSNGGIRADGLKGAFDASTSNGSIRARVEQVPAGSVVRAVSSNGNVDLALPGFSGSQVRASTSNSGIIVRLPSSVNADVRASTSNASITTDFEVTMRGTISKNRLEGKIGSGGGLIELSSSNGGIRIEKM